MSTSPAARLAIETAVLAAVVATYDHWKTYPIVNGKRCKAEPVVTASYVVGCDPAATMVPLTLAQVRAALNRLVVSGELERSTALQPGAGREVQAYSPAARFDLYSGDALMCGNINAVQCDAAIVNFGIQDARRVSVSDRVGG